MRFVRVLKASNWKVEKISETDWVIKSPDGMYKNENGKEYHFKTKEDALEELDYLRAEHKFDKKSNSEDYDLAYNTLEECVSNGLITNPDTDFEDIEFELIEQAGLNPDEMDDIEYNYWKDLFLEAWKEVDWN